MSRMRTLAAIALAGAVFVAVVGVPAQAGHPTPDPPILIADATKQPFIDLHLAAHPNQAMYVSEQEGGAFRPLAAVVLDPAGHRVLPKTERWRCDRRNRRFVAALVRGGAPVATFGIRTPSCRRRLSVGVARRSRVGAQVRVVVRDRWGIGDLPLRFCLKPPTAPRRCKGLRLPPDRRSVSTRFRAGSRGHYGLAVHGPGSIRVPGQVTVGEPLQQAPRVGALPKVLVAGDSMMQGLDGFISDRLGSRAKVFRDVNPNSGISKPGLDWVEHAIARGESVRPKATVVFLGANEGFNMTTLGGHTLACCSPAWLAEYQRRVRTMMRAYANNGRGKVIWLNMPQVRYRERHALQLIVNAAIRQAARQVRNVRVLRLDQVFTPGGRYRDVMTYRGRRVRVRENDGIHLTLAGARIAADKVHAALRSARVVR